MANVDLWYEARDRDPEELSVRKFSVQEVMSAPFRVGLLCARRGNVDLAAMVGRRATFRILVRGPRVWSGVVRYMEQVQAEPTGESTYFLEIVPELSRLDLRSACRVFQQKAIPTIVREVLAASNVQAKWVIDEKAHRKLDYRVQYNETDLHFVERMLAEAGLSYHFEDMESESLLVITDAPEAKQPGLEVVFRDNPTNAAGLQVTHVHVSQAMATGTYQVRDYDFRKPDLRPTGEAPRAARPDFDHVQYRYAPGYSVVETLDEQSSTPVGDDRGIYRSELDFARARAQLLVDGARAERRQVRYQTNAFELSPGSVFVIAEHPHPDLSAKHGLLVLETTIDGEPTTSEWSIGGRATFADSPYRPPPSWGKPRVLGPQTGVVVGPSDQEIHVDERGRVRVQMHWDEKVAYDQDKERCTCWLRVSQGWAGAGFGMVMIPRVGQEVLVAFLDGDPDQPIVVGRLFNETHPLPYPLPQNKTVSTWQSRSSPRSDGYNELKFEDDAGKEQVYLQAQRDMSTLVKRDESITVRGSRSAGIGSVDSIHAGTKHEVTIGQAQDPPPTIPPTRFTMIDKKITLTTGEATIELDGPDIKLMAKGNILLSAGNGIAITAVGGGSLPGPASAPAVGRIEITAARTLGMASVGAMSIGATSTVSIGGTGTVHVGSHDQLELAARNDVTVSSSGGAVKVQGGPMVQINPTAGLPADRVTEGVSPSPAPPTMLLPIVTGAATVFIGGPSFPLQIRRLPDGSLQVGDHITIRPGAGRYPDFQSRVMRDLAIMSTTPSGSQRLNNIQNNPNGRNVVIREYSAAEAANPDLGPNNSVNNPADGNGVLGYDSSGRPVPGSGTDAEIGYNPDIQMGPRGEREPSDGVLFHELGHFEHGAYGVDRAGEPMGGHWDDREEWQTIEGGVNRPGGTQVPGVTQSNGDPYVSPSENQYLGERGYPYVFTDHDDGVRPR